MIQRRPIHGGGGARPSSHRKGDCQAAAPVYAAKSSPGRAAHYSECREDISPSAAIFKTKKCDRPTDAAINLTIRPCSFPKATLNAITSKEQVGNASKIASAPVLFRGRARFSRLGAEPRLGDRLRFSGRVGGCWEGACTDVSMARPTTSNANYSYRGDKRAF